LLHLLRALTCLALLLAAPHARAEDPPIVVQIWTITPGPSLTESTGHTLLRIKTAEPLTDRTYDFGRYDVTSTFVLDLLRGELHFQMESWGTRQTAEWISSRRRSIISRTLDLPVETAEILNQRLLSLDLPENRAFVYDPGYANCATKVRDLVDEIVFQGAWSAAAKQLPGASLREGSDEALAARPTWRWLVLGAFGPLGHAPHSRWEATFLPFQLGEELDALGRGEGPVPLPPGVGIRPPKFFHDAKVTPPPPAELLGSAPTVLWGLLMLSLVPALIAPRRVFTDALLSLSASCWALVGGGLGTVLWLLQSQPSPLYRGNLVVLALHPFLWLFPAMVRHATSPPAGARPQARRAAVAGLIACAVLPALGASVMIPYGQPVTAHLPPIAALHGLWLAVVWRLRSTPSR
jgi:hypothetical protein